MNCFFLESEREKKEEKKTASNLSTSSLFFSLLTPLKTSQPQKKKRYHR